MDDKDKTSDCVEQSPLPSPINHAHWDCFCGASSDAMLAACLEAFSCTENKASLIPYILRCIRQTSILQDSDVLSLETRKSWREEGFATTQAWFTLNGTVLQRDGTSQNRDTLDGSDALKADFRNSNSSVALTLAQIQKILMDAREFPAWSRDMSLKTLNELATAIQETTRGNEDDNVCIGLACVLETIAIFLALQWLRVQSVSCSRLPLGSLCCSSSTPVPTPTALKLMLGMPTCNCNVPGVTVTDTAAAILRVLVKDKLRGTSPPSFVPNILGMGATTATEEYQNNICCRIILGVAVEHSDENVSPVVHEQEPTFSSATRWNMDDLVQLETNLDDTTPEILSFVIQKLLQNGSIDAWVQPIVMKKGRPAHTLCCLVRNNDNGVVENLLNILFRETTTLGVRIQKVSRAALRREFRSVATPFVDEQRKGVVNVKVGYLGNEAVSIKAEFDHCKEVSQGTGVPLKKIASYAVSKVQEQLDSTSGRQQEDQLR